MDGAYEWRRNDGQHVRATEQANTAYRLFPILLLSVFLAIHSPPAESVGETPNNCLPESPGSTVSVIGIPVTECMAIWEIYQANNGENWSLPNPGWPNGPPCDGFRISCREMPEIIADGVKHVNAISLSAKGLSGVLSGDAFTALPYLEQLDLGGNSLSGNIPSQLSGLKYLNTLKLDSNNFTGEIPNGLMGEDVAPDSGTEYRLDLSSNDLSGGLPLEIGNDATTNIWFHHNSQLSGPIPVSFTGLTTDAGFSHLLGFYIYGTQVCEPQYAAMQDWLATVSYYRKGSGIADCDTPPVDPPGDDTPPGDPSPIKASDGTSTTQVTLGWSAVNDADYYYLERAAGTAPPFTWIELATPAHSPSADPAYIDVITKNDPDAQPGLAFQYRVKACKESGVCSDFTTHDQGYTSLPSPRSGIGDLFIGDCDWIRLGCGERPEPTCLRWDADEDGVHENATYFRVLMAKDTGFYPSYAGNENKFEIADDKVSADHCAAVDTTLLYGKPTLQLVIQACNAFHCGYPVLTTKSPAVHVVPIFNVLFGE